MWWDDSDETNHLTTISKKDFTTVQSGLSNRNNQQPSSEFVDIVRFVKLEILENNKCNTEHGKNDAEGEWKGEDIFDENSMFCSDANKGQGQPKGHCAGDQGGPLVCKDNENDEAIVAGVISWSKSCGNSPGVYSRVTHVLQWIKEYLVSLHFALNPVWHGTGHFLP